MNKYSFKYETEADKTEDGLRFYFISKGEKEIIKVIQYSFVQELSGYKIFNLGFGDYDLESDTISDEVNTNNGDVYRVFNTVLSTVSVFFSQYGDAMLMIQGSDGRLEYYNRCRLQCQRKCIQECRNFNRRMQLYRSYVDRYYKILIADYQLLGGIKNEENISLLEPYERNKKYDSILLFRKKNNFRL